MKTDNKIHDDGLASPEHKIHRLTGNTTRGVVIQLVGEVYWGYTTKALSPHVPSLKNRH